jgi:hypothetical protein
VKTPTAKAKAKAKADKAELPATARAAKKAGFQKIKWETRPPTPPSKKKPPFIHGVGPDGRILICYPDPNTGAYTDCHVESEG